MTLMTATASITQPAHDKRARPHTSTFISSSLSSRARPARRSSHLYSAGRGITPPEADAAPSLLTTESEDTSNPRPPPKSSSPPFPAGIPAQIMERVGFKDVEIRLPETFSPLERVALSAEGDLQRIISSYYNAAVTVSIKRCAEVEPGLFDREVDLSVLGRVFCTATSSLSPKTQECAHFLREKSVGLGQLFRYLRVYPTFRLLDVGREEGEGEGGREEGVGGFWRLYELDCPEVINCRIFERFKGDTFHRRRRRWPVEVRMEGEGEVGGEMEE